MDSNETIESNMNQTNAPQMDPIRDQADTRGEEVICNSCSLKFHQERRKTFFGSRETSGMGFMKYKCPKCGKKVVYPMSRWTIKVYLSLWILLLGLMIFVIISTQGKTIVLPGAILIFAAAALIDDFFLSRRVKARHPGWTRI